MLLKRERTKKNKFLICLKRLVLKLSRYKEKAHYVILYEKLWENNRLVYHKNAHVLKEIFFSFRQHAIHHFRYDE